MTVNNAGLLKGDPNAVPLFNNYRYDQLNRLVGMQVYTGLNIGNNEWSSLSAINDYKEAITYDPNGNILSYLRNGDAARASMDNLSYFYKANTNQLHKVADAATDVSPSDYSRYNDIKQGQGDDNYRYDAIGNLVSDNSENIREIQWTLYGKISSITKDTDNKPLTTHDRTVIEYGYDAGGNRISKKVTSEESGIAKINTTIYVRDASGNVMSVYEKRSGEALEQAEVHLYGSSRLGMVTEKALASHTIIPLDGDFGNAKSEVFTRGEKFFELSNHLGSVLVTVSDRKIGIDANGTVDNYIADVVSAQDYYSFGQIQPGRKYGMLGRYGFNGKEQDMEVKGGGAQYDYGFRIYDPRLGRFLSVDPLTREYPWYTPYQFAGNKPIWYIDLDGLEEALPKLSPMMPQLTNPSESTCQGCAAKSMMVRMYQDQEDHENLKKEYETWRSSNPIDAPIPPKYQAIAANSSNNSATIQQGGLLGSKEHKLFKANVDQLYTISQYVPIVGDLHDIKDVLTNVSKGDFVAASLSAVFLIPGSDFIKPIKSLVKSDKQLLKYAVETFEGNKALSKEATDLVDKFRKGLDGGIGGHEVFKGVSELRGKSGARVYYKETKDGIEILGYSNKNNQKEVINRLKKIYEKKD